MRQIILLSITTIIVLGIMCLKSDITLAYSKKFNMSFLYGGNSSYYLEKIDNTKGALDMVSPSYFDLNPDGSLKLVNIDKTLISSIHRRGIKVVPFLSNHWNRDLGRAALLNREKLSTEVVSALKNYDLDGVNVDIENLTPEDKENLTNLVRLIRQKLPAGKELSVSVSANARGVTTGWHGSYDVGALANSSDYLMLMAYDDSAGSQVPKAGASLKFVEDSVRHLLSKGVNSQKIVLGMPFYGRYWSDRDSTIKANSIHLTTVDNLISRFNPSIYFDPVAKSPMFVFSVREGDSPTVIGGKVLPIGEYTVWYENNDSFKTKLELVTKYNLRGAGSWRLGQESPDLWNYYRLWLDNKYFSDIIGHWAEKEIVYNIRNEYMIGVNSREFLPDGVFTRAQAAVVLTRLISSGNTSIEENVSFSDVPSSHWAYDGIMEAQRRGIMRGVGGNMFKPDDPITREQVAVTLDRLLNVDENIDDYISPYTDMEKGTWSYDAVMRLTKLGILSGYPDRQFKPLKNLSRAEMAALVYKVDNKES